MSGSPTRVSGAAVVLFALLALSLSSARARASLVSFALHTDGDAIVVTWETDAEPNTLAYHVLRATRPDALDAADGTRPDRITRYAQPPNGGDFAGGKYTVHDTWQLRSGVTYFYWIEETELNGKLRLIGPRSTVWHASGAADVFSLPALAPTLDAAADEAAGAPPAAEPTGEESAATAPRAQLSGNASARAPQSAARTTVDASETGSFRTAMWPHFLDAAYRLSVPENGLAYLLAAAVFLLAATAGMVRVRRRWDE